MSRDEMLGALGRGDEVAAREMLAGAVLALLEKFDALAPEMSQSQVRLAKQRDEAVGKADAELEQVVAAAIPLLQYGSPDALANVTLALQRVADAIGWQGEHSDLSGLVRVSLARLLWALAAMALALDRVDLLPLLNRVALPVRYGTAYVAAVADTSLRYLVFYEGSAGKTYEALSEWFASLGALDDYKLLTIRDGLTPAFAEADLILGLRLLAERERDVYCEGAALDSRPAEQRLIRRLADPAQVPELAAFYGVKSAELTELLAERYSKVAAKGPWGRGGGSLFGND
jgi:hypothetical protein